MRTLRRRRGMTLLLVTITTALVSFSCAEPGAPLNPREASRNLINPSNDPCGGWPNYFASTECYAIEQAIRELQGHGVMECVELGFSLAQRWAQQDNPDTELFWRWGTFVDDPNTAYDESTDYAETGRNSDGRFWTKLANPSFRPAELRNTLAHEQYHADYWWDSFLNEVQHENDARYWGDLCG